MGSWCFLWDSSSLKTFFSSPSQLYICCQKTRNLSELQNVNFLHKAKPFNQILPHANAYIASIFASTLHKTSNKTKKSFKMAVCAQKSYTVQIFPKCVWFYKIACSSKIFFHLPLFLHEYINDISQLWHISTKLVTPPILSITLSLDKSIFYSPDFLFGVFFCERLANVNTSTKKSLPSAQLKTFWQLSPTCKLSRKSETNWQLAEKEAGSNLLADRWCTPKKLLIVPDSWEPFS